MVASGGLSHFVVDEELDQTVLKAIEARDGSTPTLPEAKPSPSVRDQELDRRGRSDGAPRVRGGRLRALYARPPGPAGWPSEMAVAVDVVERLRALDTCAVSDALDSLGLRGAVAGIVLWPGGRVTGRVRTVALRSLGDGEAAPSGSHLGAKTIDSAVPGDVHSSWPTTVVTTLRPGVDCSRPPRTEPVWRV